MNSLDCERISAKASARSFDAAVTRSPISPCTFAPAFSVDQLVGVEGGGGGGTHVGQLHGPGTPGGGFVGLMVCQAVPTKSFSASQEYHSADQLRAGKCGRLMVGSW